MFHLFQQCQWQQCRSNVRQKYIKTFSSINYVINSTFRKIFNTRSQEVVDICLEMFNCLPAEMAIAIRKKNFLNKFCVTNNESCTVFTDHAKKELATL